MTTMLIPSFFITGSDTALDLVDILLPGNTCFTFKINIREINSIRPLYQAFLKGKLQSSFCLWIEWDDGSYEPSQWDVFIDYVTSFTFHSLYLTPLYQTPFLIFKTHGVSSAGPIALIRKKLSQQGFLNIDYIHIDPGNRISGPGIGKKWVYRENYSTTLLRDAGAVETSLLVSIDSAKQLQEQIKDMERVENDLLASSPDIYFLLHKNMLAAMREKELHFEISLLKEEIDSQNSYYSFYTAPESEFKKKVTEISEFYQNEYEVLPMWYKRFGHILKVLTGKRSFRSLFDDNVKKYKV